MARLSQCRVFSALRYALLLLVLLVVGCISILGPEMAKQSAGSDSALVLDARSCYSSGGVVGFLAPSSIFSIQRLPCAPNATTMLARWNSATRREPVSWRPKRAYFITGHHFGTALMRGKMLASALNSLPDWEATVSEGEYRFLQGPQAVDLCIIVKELNSGFQDWCRSQGALIFWDVLDKYDKLRKLASNPPVWPSSIYLALTQSANYNAHLRRYRHHAEALYHHHSNPGVVSDVRNQVEGALCRVVFVGDAKPDLWSLDNVVKLICASPRVLKFSIVRQHIKRGDNVTDYVCPNASPETIAACAARAPAPACIVDLDSEAVDDKRQCFPEQWRFHNDPMLADASVAFQWDPPGQRGYMNARPTTRFAFWLSHGVPLVFYPYDGYVDLARLYNYSMPSGRMPTSTSRKWKDAAPDLAAALKELESLDARLQLRERGLQIAANLTAVATAERLAALYEQYKDTPRGDIAEAQAPAVQATPGEEASEQESET